MQNVDGLLRHFAILQLCKGILIISDSTIISGQMSTSILLKTLFLKASLGRASISRESFPSQTCSQLFHWHECHVRFWGYNLLDLAQFILHSSIIFEKVQRSKIVKFLVYYSLALSSSHLSYYLYIHPIPLFSPAIHPPPSSFDLSLSRLCSLLLKEPSRSYRIVFLLPSLNRPNSIHSPSDLEPLLPCCYLFPSLLSPLHYSR